jgi:hypothetical protein
MPKQRSYRKSRVRRQSRRGSRRVSGHRRSGHRRSGHRRSGHRRSGHKKAIRKFCAYPNTAVMGHGYGRIEAIKGESIPQFTERVARKAVAIGKSVAGFVVNSPLDGPDLGKLWAVLKYSVADPESRPVSAQKTLYVLGNKCRKK